MRETAACKNWTCYVWLYNLALNASGCLCQNHWKECLSLHFQGDFFGIESCDFGYFPAGDKYTMQGCNLYQIHQDCSKVSKSGKFLLYKSRKIYIFIPRLEKAIGDFVIVHSFCVYVHIYRGVYAFVKTGERGHILVNEQANVDTPPNEYILGFLLCPGDRK